MIRTFGRTSVRGAVAAATLAGAILALAPGEASAQYYYRRGYYGPNAGAVAAGVVGGMALGALAAGAARPYYAAPPAYVVEDVPVAPAPRCWYEREDVWNGYGYVPHRIRVCR